MVWKVSGKVSQSMGDMIDVIEEVRFKWKSHQKPMRSS